MPKKFTNICRAKAIPVNTAKQLGIDKISGENRLEIRNEADETHVYLAGSVGSSWWDEGGITEKEVRGALKTAKGKIHVHINSEGGSIQEGLGIYNAFKERSADITAHVDGYALSIASVFPLAASKVVSPKSAIWMIHNAWSYAQGNADDMEAQATMLREHDKMLNEIYQEHTGKSEAEIKAAMDGETWVRGSEAVAWGLADETDPVADESQASFTALPQAWLDRCANIPANILNALRVPSAPANGDNNEPPVNGHVTAGADPISAATLAAGKQNQQPHIIMNKEKMIALLNKWGVTIQANATDAQLEELVSAGKPETKPAIIHDDPSAAILRRLVTDKVNTYIAAQKITKAEAPMWIEAALKDEAGTVAILDAKPVILDAPAPLAGTKFEVGSVAVGGLAHARYAALNEKTPSARYAGLKRDWESMIADSFAQDAAKNAPLIRQGIQPVNANTYSGTLVTAFLTDGSTTTLQNKLAALRAFSRDFSTDAYKPLAVAQHKFVTAGPTVQVDATNFESGNSTVAPVTITPHQYTASITVSNADLNNGLRMENLVTIANAKLANAIMEAATAPITLANFAGYTDVAGSGNVITAANFTFTDMARIWGVLQKATQKFAVLDGAYLAKLLNQPTYFQAIAEGEGMLKAYGWDGIFLNSDWTGASNNIAAFFCDPQAIAVLAGLPLTPPAGVPGNTLQTGSFKVPGVELSVQTNSWFNLAGRTAWMSLDSIFGASKMDGTAGVAVATA